MDRAACAADACPCPQLFLIPVALFVLSKQADLKPFEALQRCGHDGCDAPLERFEQFYSRAEARSYHVPRIQKELRTRTGISRARGTVHESILYSREMLSRGTLLQVRLRGPA